MPKYSYQAITETGTTISGELEAESLESANSILASRGYIPTRVRPEQPGMSSFQMSKIRELLAPVKAPELILFTKQFRTMFNAGVAMINMLEILEAQTENPRLRRILGKMHQDIKEGASLYEAFKKHPKVFSPLYCSMIRAGESSGALPEVLDRLTYIIEHEHSVKSDIKSALTYPIIVVVFLFSAFLVLITQVIPKFVNIFKNAGLKLPLPTQIAMGGVGSRAGQWGFWSTAATITVTDLAAVAILYSVACAALASPATNREGRNQHHTAFPIDMHHDFAELDDRCRPITMIPVTVGTFHDNELCPFYGGGVAQNGQVFTANIATKNQALLLTAIVNIPATKNMPPTIRTTCGQCMNTTVSMKV